MGLARAEEIVLFVVVVLLDLIVFKRNKKHEKHGTNEREKAWVSNQR